MNKEIRERCRAQLTEVARVGGTSTYSDLADFLGGTNQSASKTTSDLGWENFELGFWHPLGSHGRESPEEIVNRKRSETEKNGWTLWSFQYRRPESLNEWYRELSLAKPRGPVVVFCSMGNSAVDPDRPGALTTTADCREYRFVGHDDAYWRPVPPLIRVPHPFGPKKDVASAFVVRCVHHPVKLIQRPSSS
jgi:hypothetical protein